MDELVSIIIPAYNAQATLAETLESVLGQTHRKIEVIVVDDGSIDGTSAIVHNYVRQDKRCKYFYQQNAGQPEALNNGLAFANGEFVAFLDADDLYSSDKIVTQMVAVQEDGADVVLTQLQRFKMDGSKRENLNISELPAINNDKKYLRTLLFLSGFQMALFTTALVRKECIMRAGGFDTSLPTAKDWDMWLRLAGMGCRFRNVQKPLYHYRKHEGSYSRSHSVYRTLNAHIKILAKLKSGAMVDLQVLQDAEKNRLFEHVRIFIYQREYGEALKLLVRGCRSPRLMLFRTFWELIYETLRKKFIFHFLKN